jgi:hypothetical protein
MFLEIEVKLLPPEWQWIVDRGRKGDRRVRTQEGERVMVII